MINFFAAVGVFFLFNLALHLFSILGLRLSNSDRALRFWLFFFEASTFTRGQPFIHGCTHKCESCESLYCVYRRKSFKR